MRKGQETSVYRLLRSDPVTALTETIENLVENNTFPNAAPHNRERMERKLLKTLGKQWNHGPRDTSALRVERKRL